MNMVKWEVTIPAVLVVSSNLTLIVSVYNCAADTLNVMT